MLIRGDFSEFRRVDEYIVTRKSLGARSRLAIYTINGDLVLSVEDELRNISQLKIIDNGKYFLVTDSTNKGTLYDKDGHKVIENKNIETHTTYNKILRVVDNQKNTVNFYDYEKRKFAFDEEFKTGTLWCIEHNKFVRYQYRDSENNYIFIDRDKNRLIPEVNDVVDISYASYLITLIHKDGRYSTCTYKFGLLPDDFSYYKAAPGGDYIINTNRNGENFGVYNSSGEKICDYYDESLEIRDRVKGDFFEIKKGEYIDEKGNIINNIVMDEGKCVSAEMIYKNALTMGICDYYSKTVLVPAIYNEIYPLSNKYYRVKKEVKYGVIDNKNNIIAPLEYNDIELLNDNRFIAKREINNDKNTQNASFKDKLNKKMRNVVNKIYNTSTSIFDVLDEKNNVVFSFEAIDAIASTDGRVVAMISPSVGVIYDENGKVIAHEKLKTLEPIDERIADLGEGYIKLGSRVLTSDGKIVLKGIYDLFIVKKGILYAYAKSFNEVSLINSEGCKTTIPLNRDLPSSFYNRSYHKHEPYEATDIGGFYHVSPYDFYGKLNQGKSYYYTHDFKKGLELCLPSSSQIFLNDRNNYMEKCKDKKYFILYEEDKDHKFNVKLLDREFNQVTLFDEQNREISESSIDDMYFSSLSKFIILKERISKDSKDTISKIYVIDAENKKCIYSKYDRALPAIEFNGDNCIIVPSEESRVDETVVYDYKKKEEVARGEYVRLTPSSYQGRVLVYREDKNCNYNTVVVFGKNQEIVGTAHIGLKFDVNDIKEVDDGVFYIKSELYKGALVNLNDGTIVKNITVRAYDSPKDGFNELTPVYSFIDTSDRVGFYDVISHKVIEPNYYDIVPFSTDYTGPVPVKLSENDMVMWKYIDHEGNLMFDGKGFLSANLFVGNIAFVRDFNDEYKIIDKKGNIVNLLDDSRMIFDYSDIYASPKDRKRAIIMIATCDKYTHGNQSYQFINASGKLLPLKMPYTPNRNVQFATKVTGHVMIDCYDNYKYLSPQSNHIFNEEEEKIASDYYRHSDIIYDYYKRKIEELYDGEDYLDDPNKVEQCNNIMLRYKIVMRELLHDVNNAIFECSGKTVVDERELYE